MCKVEGLEWIRLLYCYPEEITDELIEVMASEKKICHYIDMPIQHASDTVLKRMGRHTDLRSLEDTISRLRSRIPDIAIRTTLITGFPGERQEDQDILLGFVDKMEFDRLGVFTYSEEEDTPAAAMDDQINEELKEKHRDEVMALQQEIAFEHALNMKGRVLDALVEGRLLDEGTYTARTYMDAPGVDGLLFFDSDRELMSGDMVKVRITGANEYDLIGELCDESAK